jgi:hypothetical protein
MLSRVKFKKLDVT